MYDRNASMVHYPVGAGLVTSRLLMWQNLAGKNQVQMQRSDSLMGMPVFLFHIQFIAASALSISCLSFTSATISSPRASASTSGSVKGLPSMAVEECASRRGLTLKDRKPQNVHYSRIDPCPCLSDQRNQAEEFRTYIELRLIHNDK